MLHVSSFLTRGPETVTVSSELWQAGTTFGGQRCLHSSHVRPAGGRVQDNTCFGEVSLVMGGNPPHLSMQSLHLIQHFAKL